MNVLITRPQPQCQELAKRCLEQGINAMTMPCVEIVPLACRIDFTADIIIFLSRHAVDHSIASKLATSATIIAIGEATQRALAAKNIEAIIPKHPSSEGLLAMKPLQPDNIAGKRISIVCGENPKALLKTTLSQHGALIQEHFSYRRQCPEPFTSEEVALIQQTINIIIVTSKACFDNFIQRLGSIPNWFSEKTWLSISDNLSLHIKSHHFNKTIQAENALNASIIDALIDYKNQS